jgi:hypothetical protein
MEFDMQIEATFNNRAPFKGEITSGTEERGVLSARGPRGGSAGFARNVHSGRWFMVVTAGTSARSFECETMVTR